MVWIDNTIRFFEVISQIPRIGFNRLYNYCHAKLPSLVPLLPVWMQSWFHLEPMCPHISDFVCRETNGLHRLDAIFTNETMNALDTFTEASMHAVDVLADHPYISMVAAGAGTFAIGYGMYRCCCKSTPPPPRRRTPTPTPTPTVRSITFQGGGNSLGGKTHAQLLQDHGIQHHELDDPRKRATFHLAAIARRLPSFIPVNPAQPTQQPMATRDIPISQPTPNDQDTQLENESDSDDPDPTLDPQVAAFDNEAGPIYKPYKKKKKNKKK